MLKWVVLFVLISVSFVSAVDVNFECPKKVSLDEEFECSLGVSDGAGIYDVKVEVDKEKNSILRIWDEDGGSWKSAYYYLIGFIESGDEKNVKLKISEDGKYNVVVKLRQGDDREIFETGTLSVEAGDEEVEEDVEEESVEVENSVVENIGYAPRNASVVGDSVIVLGGNEEEVKEPEWDYLSKDAKIIDFLPYAFSLFLIFLVGFLLWERF